MERPAANHPGSPHWIGVHGQLGVDLGKGQVRLAGPHRGAGEVGDEVRDLPALSEPARVAQRLSNDLHGHHRLSRTGEVVHVDAPAQRDREQPLLVGQAHPASRTPMPSCVRPAEASADPFVIKVSAITATRSRRSAIEDPSATTTSGSHRTNARASWHEGNARRGRHSRRTPPTGWISWTTVSIRGRSTKSGRDTRPTAERSPSARSSRALSQCPFRSADPPVRSVLAEACQRSSRSARRASR